MEEVPLSVVDYYMKCGLTYEDISEELSQRYPNRRGFSPRTIRRYCKVNNLSRLTEQELEELTGEAIMEVRVIIIIMYMASFYTVYVNI